MLVGTKAYEPFEGGNFTPSEGPLAFRRFRVRETKAFQRPRGLLKAGIFPWP